MQSFLKRLGFLTVLSIMSVSVSAQKINENISSSDESDFEETIVTDRPDQTEAPVITPKGYFQIESGAQSEFDFDAETNTNTQSTLYNTTLWKYGVNRNFEFRLITEYASDKSVSKPYNGDNKDTVIKVQGFNPVSIGTKISLQKEKGIVPAISLITHLELPLVGSVNFKPTTAIPRFRFLFAHTLNDKLTFSYNIGAEWEEGTNISTKIYTASLGMALTSKLSTFFEVYGFLKKHEKADNRIDGGFCYLINNDIQLDWSGGFGINKSSPDYFISGGISVRFNAFNKEQRLKNKS